MVHLTGRDMERDDKGERVAYWTYSSSIWSRILLLTSENWGIYSRKDLFICYLHWNCLLIKVFYLLCGSVHSLFITRVGIDIFFVYYSYLYVYVLLAIMNSMSLTTQKTKCTYMDKTSLWHNPTLSYSRNSAGRTRRPFYFHACGCGHIVI